MISWAGSSPPKKQEGHPGPEQGDGQHHGVGDVEAGAGWWAPRRSSSHRPGWCGVRCFLVGFGFRSRFARLASGDAHRGHRVRWSVRGRFFLMERLKPSAKVATNLATLARTPGPGCRHRGPE